MTDLHIRREHSLGFDGACQMAAGWVDDARKHLGMECHLECTDCEQVIHFKRSGVSGTVRVTAQHFDLHAKLGFLLAGFRQRIEAEVRSNLDKLLSPPRSDL